MFRKYTFWVLLLIAIMYFNISTVSAQEDFIVTIGQDKIFTEFNDHISWFEDDPNNPEPWPTERVAYSEDNIAYVSLTATPDQAGQAVSRTGVSFEWDLESYTWDEVKNWPLNVTVDFSYNIEAYWVDDHGSANAGINLIGIGEDHWIDSIGYEVGQLGISSDTASITYTTTVEELGAQIIMQAYCQAHSEYLEDEEGNPIGTTHYSSAEVIINSIIIDFPTDLSVSMDYKRDLEDYTSKDDKIVYGADTVTYTITVTNLDSVDATDIVVNDLLPSGLKFISADPQEVYDPSTGIWNVGNLDAGASTKLNIRTKVIQSGEIINKATLIEDFNTLNNEANVTFNARNPVILVHGFNDNSRVWDSLSKKLKAEGIRHFRFEHSPGLQDPYYVANNFNIWVKYLRDEKQDIGYQGEFDIVCHSMGALVTRFWMEGNDNANAENVGQWIGIGPVNHGAAVADVVMDPTIAPEIEIDLYMRFILRYIPTNSDAFINMNTLDPQILDLNSDGIAPGVTYRVIMGTDVREIPLLDTIAKIDGNYQYTTEGDGIVANVQSVLIGSATTNEFRVKHTGLPKDKNVITSVITYLKTIE